MKQNSSIVFHPTRKSLRNRYRLHLFAAILAAAVLPVANAHSADRPEYFESFDPAKGFKPAQRDLTEIFLQLAGSLESYGSPEPYLRHVLAEHSRIENLYRRKFGKPPTSYRPNYITDAYIDRFVGNWNLLSPKFGLEPYAKAVGHTMREAIKGTRGTGTIIIDIFNRHQTKVFDAMAGKKVPDADFDALRAELVTRLELDKTSVNEEGYEMSRRDAVSYAIIIHGVTMKLFARMDQGVSPTDSSKASARAPLDAMRREF
jgi:hypothetical protein